MPLYNPGTSGAGITVKRPGSGSGLAEDVPLAPAPAGPVVGPGANYTDPQGTAHPYSPDPNVMTSLYGLAPAAAPSGTTGLTGSMDGLHTTITGQGTISQGAYEGQQSSLLNAELQKEAEARRLGYLSTITGQQSPHVAAQGGPAFDENAARTAAFARAKEQAGASALASVRALSDVMGERGLTGSSVEGNALGSVIGGGAARINNFTRDQLMTDLNRAGDIADRNQAGALQQRGQDLSLIPSLMGLITARGGVY